MANLEDLELNDAALPEVDPSQFPEPKGASRTPLYPGSYVFTMPAAFDASVDDDGTRQIVVLNFNEAYAVKAEPGGHFWQGRLSNRPYPTTIFAPDGSQTKVEVNDVGLYLKSQGFAGKLASNKEYAAAVAKYPGGSFGGTIEWSAFCNPKKQIYKDGQKQTELGCGKGYTSGKGYTKKDGSVVLSIPKDEEGRWAERFTCSCTAELWVNDRLSRIRAVKK